MVVEEDNSWAAELKRRKQRQLDKLEQRVRDVLVQDKTEDNRAMTESAVESPKEEDVVNKPNHYNQYEGFEVMDVCRQLRSGADGDGNWYRGNVFKYLARAGWKNPNHELEDLEKSKHYLEREIERVKFREGAKKEKQIDGESKAKVVEQHTMNCSACDHALVRTKYTTPWWYCANPVCEQVRMYFKIDNKECVVEARGLFELRIDMSDAPS